MKPTNLIVAHKGASAFEEEKKKDYHICVPKPYSLKNTEIGSLSSLCTNLKANNAPVELFDGYYIGYTIRQIGKEFDLLRFSTNSVVNIEMKSPLTIKRDEKIKKFLTNR